MKNGFTLVELSIVLVIIGLLIGGILVAQSMIGTAKINSQISQIQQFDIAVVNFKNKYNSLPGDSRLFDVNGDGNGVIENSPMTAGTEPNTQTAFDSEIANFWRHLSLDSFMPDKVTYSNNAATGIRSKVHIPSSPFKNGGTVVFSSNAILVTPTYYLCDFNSTTNANHSGSFVRALMTPAEGLAIDVKIDDGLVPANLATSKQVVRPTNVLSGCYSGTTNYDVSKSTKECCLQIAIGTQTGTR